MPSTEPVRGHHYKSRAFSPLIANPPSLRMWICTPHSSSSFLVLIHCTLILILILMLIFNRCLDETYVFRTVFGNRSTYAIPWPVAPLPRPCRRCELACGPASGAGQKSRKALETRQRAWRWLQLLMSTVISSNYPQLPRVGLRVGQYPGNRELR